MYSASETAVLNLTRASGIPELNSTFKKYIDPELNSSDILDSSHVKWRSKDYPYPYMANILIIKSITNYDLEGLIRDVAKHYDTVEYLTAMSVWYSIMNFNSSTENIVFHGERGKFRNFVISSRQAIFFIKFTKGDKEFVLGISVKRYCTKLPEDLKNEIALAEYLDIDFPTGLKRIIDDPKVVGDKKIALSFVKYCRGQVK